MSMGSRGEYGRWGTATHTRWGADAMESERSGTKACRELATGMTMEPDRGDGHGTQGAEAEYGRSHGREGAQRLVAVTQVAWSRSGCRW